MKKTTFAEILRKEKRYLMVGCSVLLLMVFAYMYLVSVSVIHVVIREEVNQEVRDLHTDIASLEAEYMQEQHEISEDIVLLEGYVQEPTKIFLNRTSDSLVLAPRQ